MELHFHNTSTNNSHLGTYKPRKNKFLGVRSRPSGKWVAEIKNTTQNIRMWLGTFDTAEEAARAYDEAAYLLRGSNTRTNFLYNEPCNPTLSLKIKNLLKQKRALNKSDPCSLASPTTTATNNSQTNKGSNAKSSTSISLSDHGSLSGKETNSSIVRHETNPAQFEDLYKPDLSYFMAPQFNNLDQGCSIHSTELNKNIALEEDGFYLPRRGGEAIGEEQFQDFEWMKVERQISASLYAGINEYLENISDCNDPFWDIPTLCQMFCPS